MLFRSYVMSGSPQTVEIREGKPAQVEFVNTRKESLQILKVDAETGDPLPGAVFTITRISGEPVGDRYTTDRNGSILITDLEPGSYIVTEVQAPEGYVLSATPQTVELKPGKSARLEFVNTRKESLQILKVDAGTGDPLPGAVFTITKTSGEPVGDRYTTDRNGSILITDLEPGAYIVAEVQAPEGYILSATPQTIDRKSTRLNSSHMA